MRPDHISDMAHDQRMEYVAAALGRLCARWWLYPLRGWLFAWAWEVSEWGAECARMAEALNRMAEDERVETQREQTERRAGYAAAAAQVTREVDAIVAQHRRVM